MILRGVHILINGNSSYVLHNHSHYLSIRAVYFPFSLDGLAEPWREPPVWESKVLYIFASVCYITF